MWLLDVNVPRQIVPVHAEFGIEAETADSPGWNVLTNGKLLEVASRGGFRCLLYRDRLFGQSAARSLQAFPEIAIVIAKIPQLRRPDYLEAFRSEWEKSPISPQAGEVIVWPS